jgi:hypothetical protein
MPRPPGAADDGAAVASDLMESAMNTSTAFVFAGVALALAACNNADPNRTTSVPPGVKTPTALVEPIVSPSAPPAPALRGPVPANANDAAPGTNASVAFANETVTPAVKQASKDGAPAMQAAAVAAQEAAAKAPTTAEADDAKQEMMTSESRKAGTAEDTAANSPRHGTLTAQEESTQMPKAGQVNNYSSPALEKDSGRPSDGTTANQGTAK